MDRYQAIPTTGVQDKFTVEDDRCMEYRKFRMGLGVGGVLDLDQLEFGKVNDRIVPRALIELSKVEGKVRNEQAYFPTLYKNRKNQIDVVKAVGVQLEIDAWYIVYEDGFKRMWVLDLHNQGKGWVEATIDDVRGYLRKIHS